MPAAPSRVTPRVNITEEYAHLLNQLMEDDSITDIMINGHDRVYVEKSGRMQAIDLHFESAEQVTELAYAILRKAGKENLAQECPIIDGTLPNGSRFNIILPPIAVDGPGISIRKFSQDLLTLDRMVESGALTPLLARFLKAATRLRANIVIAGATSTGKTTLLSALSAHISPIERIVTIEDTTELQIQSRNLVRMETSSAWQRGPVQDRITARDLVKTSLRMRPDRIIVGEVRGVEAFDMLQAMNTGHEGSMTTIHANSPRDVLVRLENMISMANPSLTSRVIRQQISSAVDLVIQTYRSERGERRISHVTEVIGLEGETIVAQDLFLEKPGTAGQQWQRLGVRHAKLQRALEEAQSGERSSSEQSSDDYVTA